MQLPEPGGGSSVRPAMNAGMKLATTPALTPAANWRELRIVCGRWRSFWAAMSVAPADCSTGAGCCERRT